VFVNPWQSVHQVRAIHVHHLDRSVERATLASPFVDFKATLSHTLTGTLRDIEPLQGADAVGRLILKLHPADSVGRVFDGQGSLSVLNVLWGIAVPFSSDLVPV
jgi:hypothetical protein